MRPTPPNNHMKTIHGKTDDEFNEFIHNSWYSRLNLSAFQLWYRQFIVIVGIIFRGESRTSRTLEGSNWAKNPWPSLKGEMCPEVSCSLAAELTTCDVFPQTSTCLSTCRKLNIPKTLSVWRPWRPCPSSKNHHPYNLTPCRAELGCEKSRRSRWPKCRAALYISLQKVSRCFPLHKGFCTRPFFSPQDQDSTGDCPASEAGKNGVSSVFVSIQLQISLLQQTSWMFPKIGVPPNGWFIMEHLIEMDDLGVPLFLETPSWW